MKFHSFFSILALAALTIFSACGNDSDASKSTTLMTEEAAQTGADPTIAPGANVTPPAAEPPQNASGVWHYTCPKGCEGGSGSAIPCPKCGTALTHNQVYHGAAANEPSIANPSSAPGTPGAPPPVTMPSTGKPEPPQNTAGVWHYTCPAGCAGGGGAAGPCAKCGKTLEHNKAYH